MSKQKHFKDLFNPEKREEVQKNQAAYIEMFKEISSRMIVLQGQDEANALPDLNYLIDFMQHLLEVLSVSFSLTT